MTGGQGVAGSNPVVPTENVQVRAGFPLWEPVLIRYLLGEPGRRSWIFRTLNALAPGPSATVGALVAAQLPEVIAVHADSRACRPRRLQFRPRAGGRTGYRPRRGVGEGSRATIPRTTPVSGRQRRARPFVMLRRPPQDALRGRSDNSEKPAHVDISPAHAAIRHGYQYEPHVNAIDPTRQRTR